MAHAEGSHLRVGLSRCCDWCHHPSFYYYEYYSCSASILCAVLCFTCHFSPFPPPLQPHLPFFLLACFPLPPSLPAPITPISLSPNPFPPSSSCSLFLLLLLLVCSFSFSYSRSSLPSLSPSIESVGQTKPRRLPGVWWFLPGRGSREGLSKGGAARTHKRKRS
jgi:hypothetical protein